MLWSYACWTSTQWGQQESICPQTCQQQTLFTKKKSPFKMKHNWKNIKLPSDSSKIACQEHNFLKLHPFLRLSGTLGSSSKWFPRLNVAAIPSVQKHLPLTQLPPHPHDFRASLHPPHLPPISPEGPRTADASFLEMLLLCLQGFSNRVTGAVTNCPLSLRLTSSSPARAACLLLAPNELNDALELRRANKTNVSWLKWQVTSLVSIYI